MSDSPGSVSEIRKRLEQQAKEERERSAAGSLSGTPRTAVGKLASSFNPGTPHGSAAGQSPLSSTPTTPGRAKQAELDALQARLYATSPGMQGSAAGGSPLAGVGSPAIPSPMVGSVPQGTAAFKSELANAMMNAQGGTPVPVTPVSVMGTTPGSVTMSASLAGSMGAGTPPRPTTAPPAPPPPAVVVNARPPSASGAGGGDGVKQVSERDLAGSSVEAPSELRGFGLSVDSVQHQSTTPGSSNQQATLSDDSDDEPGAGGDSSADELDEGEPTNCGESALSPRCEELPSTPTKVAGADGDSLVKSVSQKKKELEQMMQAKTMGTQDPGAKKDFLAGSGLTEIQDRLSKQAISQKLERHLQQRPSVIQLANQGIVSAASVEPCLEAALNMEKKMKRQETLKNKLEQKLKVDTRTNSAVISFSVMKYNKRNKSQPRTLQFDIAEQCLRNYEKEELQKSFNFRDLTGVHEAPDPMRLFIRFQGNKEYEVVVQDPEERQTLSQLTQLIIKTLDRPKDPHGSFRSNFEMLFDNVLPYDPAPSSHLPIDRFKSGPVDKKGKRNWAGRWMVAGVSNLYIYRDKKATIPLNVLALRHVHVTPLENNKFTLVCPHRIYVFRCISDDDRDEWLGAITNQASSEFSR